MDSLLTAIVLGVVAVLLWLEVKERGRKIESFRKDWQFCHWLLKETRKSLPPELLEKINEDLSARRPEAFKSIIKFQ